MMKMYKEEKNPIGRPLKYKTNEELQKAIDDYFKMCDEKEKPYTITGLGLAIGLDRKKMLEYGEREKFSNTIKLAKERVHAYAEEHLYKSGIAAGVIFNLKNNFGWKDKSEVEATNLNYQAQSYEEFINSTKGDEY